MKKSIWLFLIIPTALTGQNIFPSSGNVGIGIISPAYDLDVTKTVAGSDVTINATNGGGTLYTTRSVFRSAVSGISAELRTVYGTNAAYFGTTSNSDLYFITNNALGATITHTGDVGIGTASPSALLHLVKANATGIGPQIILDNSNGGYGDESAVRFASSGGNKAGIRNTLNTDSWGSGNIIFETLNPSNSFGERMRVSSNGNVGIGTTTPSEKLSVNGNIRSQKMIVTQSGWPDYVFTSAFKLKPLSEVAKFIEQHKHLPGVPSAKEVEEKGVDVGATEALLLKKMEEMTLYIINQQKDIRKLEGQVKDLQKKINRK